MRVLQFLLALVAATAFYLLVVLAGCSCSPSRTVEQDLTICRGICADRYIVDFDRKGDDGWLACRCSDKPPPAASPCADAGKP